MAKKFCEKCKREMQDINFYSYKNGQKFQQCKACITMHVDNFNPETFLWILQKADVPYVPAQWNVIRDKAYAKNPQKMNGSSVIGKYLSKMKLKQWKSYGWADSQQLQADSAKKEEAAAQRQKAQEQMVREQYQRGDISQAQYRTLVSTPFQRKNQTVPPPDLVAADPIGQNNMFKEEMFISQDDLPDIASQLTLEDKQYLALKWGRTYTPANWIQLEKTYSQMMKSFDIQDADSKNTLIFICKTTLKMNQALDCGDLEGYQKLSRVYDTLRKSAKFTAAQNKEQKNEFVDSVGQIVSYCQKHGGAIPRFKIDSPKDIVDKVIKDQKDYLRSLVYEDTSLAKEIQDYIREARNIMNNKKDIQQARERGLVVPQLTEQNIQDYKEFLNQQRLVNLKEMEGDK